MPSTLPTRRLGGLRVIVATRKAFAVQMVDDWRTLKASSPNNPPKLSFSANGELISKNASDPHLATLLSEADTIDADGQPMVLFSRLMPGPSLPERIATTDFFHDAADASQDHGMRFFLLGASEPVIENAVTNIRTKYPKLEIAGFRDGYFSDDDFDSIIQEIKEARPDILWVGMGTPRQHEFAVRARDHLTGITWIKTCGGLFDFLSGRNSRAPNWMQASGLEWLYRMALEPRRLFWRYLTTNFHAAYLLLARSGRD